MRPLAAIFRPGSCLTMVFPRNTGFGQSLPASIWDRPCREDSYGTIHRRPCDDCGSNRFAGTCAGSRTRDLQTISTRSRRECQVCRSFPPGWLGSCTFKIFAHRRNELVDLELRKVLLAGVERDLTMAVAHLANDMAAEGAITFHLRFAEPLVGCAFMRKCLVQRSIGADVGRLAAVIPGLHIDQRTLFRPLLRVAYPSQCAIGAIDRRLLPWCHVDAIEFDANAEVDPYLPHRIAEILERAGGVGARVADQNEVAPPPDHLGEAEIFEMPAVGKINVAARISCSPRELVEHRSDAEKRPFAAVEFRAATRITQPPAQPDIEQHQQQADDRRGMIALVRAYGGTRDRHRSTERDAVPAVTVEARRDKAYARVAAGERGHDEGLGLAFLPGEIARGHDIEGHVHDMKEASPASVSARQPE